MINVYICKETTEYFCRLIASIYKKKKNWGHDIFWRPVNFTFISDSKNRVNHMSLSDYNFFYLLQLGMNIL